MDATSYPVKHIASDQTRSVDPLNQTESNLYKKIKVDVIIVGAGASGLALAWHLVMDDEFKGNICLVDKNFDTPPDDEKIWSFWESEWIPDEILANLTEKMWSRLNVNVKGYKAEKKMDSMAYRSIRCSNYRNWMISRLEATDHITLVEGRLETFEYHNRDSVKVYTENHHIESKWLCTALPSLNEKLPGSVTKSDFKTRSFSTLYGALQQFLGWEITTKNPGFDPTRFTFMDFRKSEEFTFPFFYVLPFNENEALVEYTIFTDKPRCKHEMREDLEQYLHKEVKLEPDSYTLKRQEEGMIPMLPNASTNSYSNVINIGSAAGCTRASTGYTFARSWKHARVVASKIKGETSNETGLLNHRHQFFDKLFLYQLHRNPESVKNLIKGLFREPDTDRIFRFLSGTTTLWEELRMVRRMPIIPFAKAFVQNWKHLL